MTIRKTSLAGLLAGLLTCNTVLADETITVKPFFGDFHGNGTEVAIPLFLETDSNQDGYPESISIRFKVYTAGTNTVVRTTPAKKFNMPAIPAGCTPGGPNFFDYDDTITFRRRQARLNSSAFIG